MADIDTYIATPSGPIKGGLVLIHEIWGLVDHIKQVADRFAAEGYLTYAPDILTHAGMTPQVGAELQQLLRSPDPETRQAAQPLMRERTAPAHDQAYAEWAVPALREVVDELQRQPAIDARIGVLGFCFGGTYSYALAAADERVRTAVAFYGAPPDLDQIPRIGCPVLGIYGGKDERLMKGLPAVRAKMEEAGVDFTVKIYDDAEHAFFNDTAPRYDAEAAADAWQLSLDFLDRHLAG
ncbi:MAG TPA: dienelactone hydrolase family protein [Microlunatus sp.]